MKWLTMAAVIAAMSGALSAADFQDLQRLRACEIGVQTMAGDQINYQRPIPQPAADAIAKAAPCMRQCMAGYADCIKQADNASAPRFCESYLATCEAKCRAIPQSADLKGNIFVDMLEALQGNKVELVKIPGLKLFVAGSDEEKEYDWYEAKKVCGSKGLRVPTEEELDAIFCHADLEVNKNSDYYPATDPGCKKNGTSRTVKNLQLDEYYLSSTILGNELGVAGLHINSGEGADTLKFYKKRIRCVRSSR